MDKISPLMARSEFNQKLRSHLVTVPVKFPCPACDKVISSAMEWICGKCETSNTRTEIYSFLNRCQKCDHAPQSCVCPQCEALIVFDTTHNEGIPARKYIRQPRQHPPAPSIDPGIARQHQHDSEKLELKRKIEIAELNLRLKEIEERAKIGSSISAQEQLENSFTEFETRVLGIHKLANERRQQYRELYRDDPKMLEMVENVISNWVEDNCG